MTAGGDKFPAGARISRALTVESLGRLSDLCLAGSAWAWRYGPHLSLFFVGRTNVVSPGALGEDGWPSGWKAAVLKTAVRKRTVGSNPTPSANNRAIYASGDDQALCRTNAAKVVTPGFTEGLAVRSRHRNRRRRLPASLCAD